jgi:predicted ester cyclase
MSENTGKQRANDHASERPVLPPLDVPYRDISELLEPEGGRRQPLRGFKDDYVDIVHYIVKCTHDIWEGAGIGLIYTHYTQNARVHTSDGMLYGRDQMVENTIQRQAGFPNARAYADDVIWSGDEVNGFHSSHRVLNISRNTGHSIYGPPTGRWVRRYGVAHCLVLENYIVEEWLIHDNLAVTRGLGLDEHEWGRRLAQRDVDAGFIPPQSFGDVEHHRGQEPPPLEPTEAGGTDPEALMRRSIHEIWNWRLLNQVDTYYAPNLTCYTTGNRLLYGRGDYRYNIVALLAAFPDALVQVDHTCALPNGEGGYRVATRWTFQGTHTGPGWYGPPTGKRVRLIGVSHSEIENDQIVREWLLYDEIALLKQLKWPS